MKKLDIHNLSKKEIQKIHTRVRSVIQLLFFLFIPSVYTSAFAGIKYIFTQIGNGEMVECTSFVIVLTVICAYTIVFGRFFCGFACSFGSLGDAVHMIYVAVCKKLKKKSLQIGDQASTKLTYVKYGILIIIVLMCYAGVYSKTQGASPWDVFSMLHAGNFKLGKYAVGLVLLIAIISGMCVKERFFCRFLCPMGAVFSLLPVLPGFSLHRDRENCIKSCSACTRKCPSDIELPAEGTMDVTGDCFQCQKCIDTCPKGNVHCGIKKIKGNEVWFTLIRAGILLGICAGLNLI